MNDASYDGVLEDERGPAAQLYSGAKFWIKDPRPEDFNLEDVAHHLSHVNRFSGGTTFPYPVARHSVLCYHLTGLIPGATTGLKRWALAHDIPEFVIGDHIRPVKKCAPSLSRLEAPIMKACAKWLRLPNLSPAEKDSLRFIDNLACSTEKAVLLPNSEPWPDMPEAEASFVNFVRQTERMSGRQIRREFQQMMFRLFPHLVDYDE